jgi:uncharacterized membrane protein
MTPAGRGEGEGEAREDGARAGNGERAQAALPARERARDVRQSLPRTVLRVILGAAMIAIGIAHFASPQPFVQIIPKALPWPLFLVYLSGAAEIAGGAGLFVPRLRRAASFGLIALYIAVFPANVNMALHQIPLGGQAVSPFVLWGRLPLQLVFIAWAYWVGKPRPAAPATLRDS